MAERRKKVFKKRSNFAFNRIKPCRFCKDKSDEVDYKDPILSRYSTEQGKILPARITGNCAYHQRQVAKAIRRARTIALMPFTRD